MGFIKIHHKRIHRFPEPSYPFCSSPSMSQTTASHGKYIQRGIDWYHGRDWEPFPFQIEMMEAYLSGKSGILNAPTGSGKTMAMWVPILLDWIRQHSQTYQTKKNNGLVALWITPLRALAKDIVHATAEACIDMEVPWRVETRTGDTPNSQRDKQKKKMPEGLITTPESLHVLFANKNHQRFFKNIQVIVVDEWHELLGSKRGVQTELVISHLRQINPQLKIWGISATIGNLEQASEVLMGNHPLPHSAAMVKAKIDKVIDIESVLPQEIEKFPWSGHLGVNMLDQVLPLIRRARTTLLFTNTRSQCELWYQALLEADPDLAGQIAMHHGSIASDIRGWVEDALHDGRLRLVVCTSSLDLGVDFRPVEQVIQVGGPKGVARIMQRAGRAGHRPGEISSLYFVPTHSLELIEAAALRQAVEESIIEDRPPIIHAWDVLVQYMMTLAVGDGLRPEEVLKEIQTTYCYQHITEDAFRWCLDFLVTGGNSLQAYDEYKKILPDEEGVFRPVSRKISLQHRLSIGTIVGDVNLTVKFMKGGRIGTVEETFISQLNEGDTFWFAGRALELVKVRNLDVLVRLSKKKKGKIPRWMGARMQLSSQLSAMLRSKMDQFLAGDYHDPEIRKLVPLLEIQQQRSAVPHRTECLVEYIESREGHHLYFFPFEGRVIHEIMAALLAWRIAQMTNISFSIAMNDYGFELLSDAPIPMEEALEAGLFSPDNLEEDVRQSINQTEMARARFREISRISGLVFEGYPGKRVKSKHLQASTALIFKVFQEYDPKNLLFQQAYREVLDYQINGLRLQQAMERLNGKELLITRPERFTPFAFPIMVDRLRARLSSERLMDRVAKMQVMLE